MKNLPPELQTYIQEVGAAYSTIEKYINSLLTKIDDLEFKQAMDTTPATLSFNPYIHKHRYSDTLTETQLTKILADCKDFDAGAFDDVTQAEFHLSIGSTYGLKPGQINAIHNKYRKENT